MSNRVDIRNELVTTSDIPSDPLSVPISDDELKKIKSDPLYKKRVLNDPGIKKNIKKIGENTMKTVVTYSSNSTQAISKQWHLIFHIDDKSWNSWDISNVSHKNNTHSFTLTSHNEDQRMSDDWLKSTLVAGVTYKMKQNVITATESELNNSILSMDLSPDEMADLLLSEEVYIENQNNETL